MLNFTFTLDSCERLYFDFLKNHKAGTYLSLAFRLSKRNEKEGEPIPS